MTKPQNLGVGYDPCVLDASITRYIRVAERNVAQLDQLGDRLGKTLSKLAELAPGPDALDEAADITLVYDRMVKASMNLVKATDELTRLRSFASGGPDTRPDLTAMSELELRRMLLEAVTALGITSLDQLQDARETAIVVSTGDDPDAPG